MEIVSPNVSVIAWHEEKFNFQNAELCVSVQKEVCKLGLYDAHHRCGIHD